MDVISMISKPDEPWQDSPTYGGLYGSSEVTCNGPRVHTYLQEMNRRVLSKYDLMTVGETAGVTLDEAKKYANADGTELDMVFQFEHVGLDSGPSDKWSRNRISLPALKENLSKWQTALDGVAWNSLFFCNHDQPRIVSRLGDDSPASAKCIATMLHMMQGTPYVYQGEELGMTVTSQGVLQDFQELGKITDKTVTLEAANLRNGVVQATVFNAQGCIYADRLFFVRNAEQETAPMTFTGTAETFEPYSAIKMGVQGGAPGSTISLAVRDAAHTEYTFDNGNIYTEMLLSSQIRGFVEDPGYYFETDDEEHRRALDLLLMIQGWRRFDWYTMAIPGAFTLQYMPEITQMMSGEVNTYQAEQAENAIFEAGLAQSTSVSKTEGEKEAEKADKSSRYTLTGNSEEPDSDDPAAREGQRTMDDAVTTINNMRADADAHFRNAQAQTGETADKMKLFGQSNMKREVVVHAEFTKPGAEQGIVGDVTTEKGLFKIESPRFYDGCYFFLAASDSTKWKGKTADQITWVVPNEDEKDELNYPEFYVKLSPIYPRFVKPYSFYQSNLAQAPKGSALAEDWLNDGSRTLDQVTIGARRNGMSRFDASKPAFVIDAYQAFNEVSDAGIGHGVFVGPDNFANQIARTYIGDMNMERHYEFELRYDSRLANSDQTNWGPKEREVFEHMKNLDKVYIYTDYSPRREGDKHFEANNQPQVIIDLRQFQGNDGPRPVYRDRRYILPGYAVGEVFYQPDYSKNPLPEQKDYRRTLYWNPSLQLDSKGEAQVEFYNNSKKTQICVSAEGMTPDGHLLTGRDAPENH